MAKSHTKFVCQKCGFISPKYMGRCPQCNKWNSFVEEIDETRNVTKRERYRKNTDPVLLSSVSYGEKKRVTTNLTELDRCLGGGMVSGQVILLSGEPGVGKSTLILEIIKSIHKKNLSKTFIYISGEESPEQIALRAKRLSFSRQLRDMLILYPETSIEKLLSYLTTKISRTKSIKNNNKESLTMCIVVDSIQTMWSEELNGAPGSVGQVRECAYKLTQWAKQANIPVIIVGQVTKEGVVAGPKVLEHLVDTVLYMEGSRYEALRVVKVLKNRFGATDEIAVFEMKEDGIHEVTHPSVYFMKNRTRSLPGTAATIVMEGTQPIFVEIQSLVSYSELKSPRRVGNGISYNRLSMICAIVAKHLRMPLERFDVYVNVSGGLTISEPAADLAIALSIYSSYKNNPLPKKTVCIGELSLVGEVQNVPFMEKRVRKSKKFGYTNIISYKTTSTIVDAVKKLLNC